MSNAKVNVTKYVRVLPYIRKRITWGKPCLICGSANYHPECAHIIQKKYWDKAIAHRPRALGLKEGNKDALNLIPLCRNCHRNFDDILLPVLYKALAAYGCKNIPPCWKQSKRSKKLPKNMISDMIERIEAIEKLIKGLVR